AGLAPDIVMPAAAPRPAPAPAAEPAAMPPPEPVAPVAAPSAPAASGGVIEDAEDWLRRVAACDLRGPARELAAHSAFVSHAGGVLTLALAPGFEYLRTEKSTAVLAEALGAGLGAVPKIVF